MFFQGQTVDNAQRTNWTAIEFFFFFLANLTFEQDWPSAPFPPSLIKKILISFSFSSGNEKIHTHHIYTGHTFCPLLSSRIIRRYKSTPCAYITPAHILSECYSRMRFRLCNQLRLRGRTIVPSFAFTSRGFVSFVLRSFIETKTNRIHRSPFPNMITEIYVTASLNY